MRISPAAPRIRPGPPPRSQVSQANERVLCACLFLLPIGAAVLVPRLPLSLAAGDFLVAPITGYGVLAMTRRGSAATVALKRAAPWLYLILAGSVAGLIGVGIPSWAVVDLVKNLTAVLSFFAVWHLLSTAARVRAMLKGWIVGGVLTAGLLLAAGGPRPSATFYHPNYAAHYLACAALLVAGSPGIPRVRRVALALLFVAGIAATASFGGLAMLIVGGGLLFVGVREKRGPSQWRSAPRWTRVALVAALGLLMSLLVPAFLSQRVGSEALNAERLDRSASTRSELYWDALGLLADHPTGAGPTGIKNRELLVRDGVPWESHSDPLGYLLERGVVGLAGLAGFAWCLFGVARRFALSRAVFLMLVVSGLLRETLNFRHLWLALALAFAVDLQHARAEDRRGPSAVAGA